MGRPDGKRIGNIGEAETLAAFVRRGIPVYVPFGDAESADLVADFGGKLQRIQVKTSGKLNRTGVSVEFCVARFSYDTEKRHTQHLYSVEEVDWFALYDTINKRLYLLRNSGDMVTVCITFGNPKKPSKVMRWSSDYLFDAVIDGIQ